MESTIGTRQRRSGKDRIAALPAGGGSGSGGPLGNLADNCDAGRAERRRERRTLSRFLSRMGTLPRVRICGERPVDSERPVALRLAEAVAHFANLQTVSYTHLTLPTT